MMMMMTMTGLLSNQGEKSIKVWYSKAQMMMMTERTPMRAVLRCVGLSVAGAGAAPVEADLLRYT